MFYSHHLLARKAPLGQIWMAATMHAKINRRKLDKLDIIKICEQILNPTVPMALRLSGILMGGVVIVYERKVKLLYEDVTRFLMEINEAWKVKPAVDPTVLPKGKAQAKFEAVTLPNVVETETEQTMHFSDASFNINITRLQRMRLDDVDEQFININIGGDEDPSHQHHHQAEAANITLFDEFTSCPENTDLYNRFERFDIGEDEETQINFTPQEQPTLAPSPARQDAQPQSQTPPIASPSVQHEPGQENQPLDELVNPQPEAHTERDEAVDCNETKQQQPCLRKRKARRNLPRVIMDDDQIMIPGNVYQLWLHDASSIISKRGRRNKSLNPVLNTKIANLMEIPPVALLSGQISIDEPCYSARLLKLWRKCTMMSSVNGVSSGEISPDSRENPALHSHSPPQGFTHCTVPSFVPGDFHSEVGSLTIVSSMEKARAGQGNIESQTIYNDAVPADHFDFPMSPAGQCSRSAPSSGSGHTLFPSPEELIPTSTRARKRQHSSARSNLGNLNPVEEEGPLEQDVRSFKIPRQSPKGTTFDSELLEETGPTQTPHPVISNPSADSITQSICTHLKMHFDTPGVPQSESVEQLACGMNRKKAAMLFYQTCVLATLDFVKVYQAEPYGDILISRGPKM